MRKNGFSEDKILFMIVMVMATMFFMPIVGIFMICKKESNPMIRFIGAVLLVIGIMIMLGGNVPQFG